MAHYLVRQILSRFNHKDYERLLLELGSSVIKTLGELSRDALIEGALRLLRAQPVLIKYIFQHFVR